MKPSKDKVLLGEGLVNWEPSERTNRQYGFIWLSNLEESHILKPDQPSMIVPKTGRLWAVVVKNYPIGHPGDLVLGIKPNLQPKGTKVLLGEGTLVFSHDDWYVGIEPFDHRAEQKMDVQALYNVLHSMVQLVWEPIPDMDKKVRLLDRLLQDRGPVMCVFSPAYRARCNKPLLDEPEGQVVCHEHAKIKCAICGEQAVEECSLEAMNLVCGAPLCAKPECHQEHNRKFGHR